MSDWYKDAIFYEVPVRSFHDGNGDGIGDFVGLTSKLDYIHDLGVDCIWLLPMYPSPFRDDGYDVSDFCGIHPDYGTMDEFKAFLEAAHALGIRVIVDLVLNHSSDQHAWFKEGRQSADAPTRNYYVWSDSPTRYEGARIIFTDTETSNWTWDPVAKSHYWHRFFHHQPDLNFDNPSVQQEMLDIASYWLAMGIDGFRCDAVPYLFEREGTNSENLPETHEFSRRMRAQISRDFPDALLLAEANQWPNQVRDYFGNGDEFHMAFNFPIMPRLFMALRSEDRAPIVDILNLTPSVPEGCQWAMFLRNHDELTLEMVSDMERDYMYREFAGDPQMRLNVGIRRRLAPLLQNGRRQNELLHSLLFSLPGSPFLYYGDEIGMGDNVYLGDRRGVRTPMQWSNERNAGFSTADPSGLFSPVIQDPVYSYQSVNVEAQMQTPTSFLNWVRRMIRVRKCYSAFGRGSISLLQPENQHILAFLREHESQIILCVANLSRFVQPVGLDLSAHQGKTPVELIGNARFPAITTQPYPLSLAPHGFYWFRLEA